MALNICSDFKQGSFLSDFRGAILKRFRIPFSSSLLGIV